MLSAAAALLAVAAPSSAADEKFPVYYIGSEQLVLDRLKLDPATEAVSDLDSARTAVIQDALPPPGPALEALKRRVEQGMGLVIITGRNLDPASLDYLTDGAITQTGTVDAPLGPTHASQMERLAAIIEYQGAPDDPIARNISWRSAVRVHARALLESRGAEVLVATSKAVRGETPILLRVKVGNGTVYVLNVWLRQGDQRERAASYLKLLAGIEGAENYDFQRWPYFNWLLYYLSRAAANAAVQPYGDWVASPVPNRSQVAVMLAALVVALAALLTTFIAVRRYSLAHPEQLERLYLSSALAEPRRSSLGAAAVPQPVVGEAPASRGDPRWELVGFHRPLSGFFYNCLLALVVMIPFNFVTTYYLERNYVNPFLEARGAWAAVVQFMLFFFTLLDVGTAQAMVKYFAEYRVREPARAIMYAQFFVWFQALSGMLQIGVFTMAAATWMPHTTIAFMTWLVVLHALIQFPGFVAIFLHLFRGLQRFDYAQLLIVLTFVLNPLMQMGFAIYGRHWGLEHPVFGEGLGVVLGFAIGGIAANLLMCLFCAVFTHWVGIRLVTLFLAHFDRDTIKRALIYGAKLTGGQVAGALSWGLTPVIMGALLSNYLELTEIWILVYALTFAYTETGAYIFTTLMPSISESYSQRMLQLTRRYIDQGMRWALMIGALLAGAYIAFLDVFIHGLLPPQFLRATGVLVLIHIYRVADFSTRLPDQVFLGTGRTGLFTWTQIAEHGGRIALSWYLIKWYGFEGLFYAFTLSALLKSALAWPLMAKLIVMPVFSIWQTFLNPTLAGIGNYFILRAFADAVWQGPGHTASAWVVVLFCLFGSLPVYMFLSGLLGWDRASLREFRDAAEIVPRPFGVLARFAYRVVAFGCSLSPLQERFPGRLVKEAFDEAAILTASKAELR
jgi:O-antigen/teichoic acid export membrane protein